MIILSLCNSCLQPFQVTLLPREVDLLKTVVDDNGLCDCPKKCGGKISISRNETMHSMGSDQRLKAPIPLTGMELYQAVMGTGLPAEIARDPVVVDALLKSNRVVKTDMTETNGKIYLNEIHLENGTVIHLTSGARGAQVLKLTKETQ